MGEVLEEAYLGEQEPADQGVTWWKVLCCKAHCSLPERILGMMTEMVADED